MANPWQFVPTSLLDEEKLNTELDEWKEAQRQRLASVWLEEQRKMLAERFRQDEGLLQEQTPQPAPEQPRPFGPLPAGYFPQPAPEEKPATYLPQPQISATSSMQQTLPSPIAEAEPPAPSPQPGQPGYSPFQQQPSLGTTLGQLGRGFVESSPKVPEAIGEIRRGVPATMAEAGRGSLESLTDIAQRAGPGSFTRLGDTIGQRLGIQTPRSGMEVSSPEYQAAVEAEQRKGMTGLIPEGTPRAIAGAVGDIASRGYGLPGIGPVKFLSDAIKLATTPQEVENVRTNWERWKTEENNPLVELTNPAQWVNPPSMGVMKALPVAGKIAEKGIGAVAEALPQVKKLGGEIAEGVGELGRTLAGESGSLRASTVTVDKITPELYFAARAFKSSETQSNAIKYSNALRDAGMSLASHEIKQLDDIIYSYESAHPNRLGKGIIVYQGAHRSGDTPIVSKGGAYGPGTYVHLDPGKEGAEGYAESRTVAKTGKRQIVTKQEAIDAAIKTREIIPDFKIRPLHLADKPREKAEELVRYRLQRKAFENVKTYDDSVAASRQVESWLDDIFPTRIAQGQNIRPIYLPEDMRFLEADRHIDITEIGRIANDIGVDVERFKQSGFYDQMPGSELWSIIKDIVKDKHLSSLPDEIKDNFYKDDRANYMISSSAQRLLSEAGYDGIRFRDNNIVIFPDSLPKVRNAITGDEGGASGAELALGLGTRAAGAGVGAAVAYDPNATPEENRKNMLLGAGVGLVGAEGVLRGGSRVLRSTPKTQTTKLLADRGLDDPLKTLADSYVRVSGNVDNAINSLDNLLASKQITDLDKYQEAESVLEELKKIKAGGDQVSAPRSDTTITINGKTVRVVDGQEVPMGQTITAPGADIPPPNPRVGVTEPAPPPQKQLVPWFRPTDEIEKTIDTSGGWLSNLGKATRVVPGGKGLAGLIDPWVAQQTHVERIPLIFRNLDDTGRNILRSAMANLESINQTGYKIKNNRFISGVNVKPEFAAEAPAFDAAIGPALSDVLEHEYRYNMPPSLKQFIQAANKVSDELVAKLTAEGVEIKQKTFEPGGHYFGRVVKEVQGVVKRDKTRPEVKRTYDSMEEGIKAGVKYEDDLLETAELGFNWLIRKAVSHRMGELVKPLGRTASELVDEGLRTSAAESSKRLSTLSQYTHVLKDMKAGRTPYVVRNIGGNVINTIKAPLGKIDELIPGAKDKLIDAYNNRSGKAGRANYLSVLKAMLDEAKTLETQARISRTTTGRAYKQELGKIKESQEYIVEGSKFGLPDEAVGVARVQQPWAAGKMFPRETADFLNNQLKRESHVIIRAAETIADTLRTMKTGFDLGTVGIQLLPLIAYKPKAWGKTFYYMHRAIADPEVVARYMAKPDVQEVLNKLIPHNLTIEGIEYTKGIERGGLLYRAMPESAARFIGSRAEAVFSGPLNVGKVETAKALLPIIERMPKEAQEAELDALAIFLNNLTGTRSSLASGIGTTQRGLESSLLFFSPRMTRASLALVGDAVQGGMKGSEARKALGGLLVANTMLAGGLYMALNEGKLPPPEFFDPSSPQFFTVKAFGQRIGLGGPHRALAVLIANSEKSAVEDPGVFLDPRDRQNNPLTRWWSGRTSPATSALWDLATGKDFMGESIYSDPSSLARWVDQQITPMWSNDLITASGEPGATIGGTIASGYGLRSLPNTPAMERDAARNDIVKAGDFRDEVTGEKITEYKNLDTVQKHIVDSSPEVKQLASTATEVYARRGDEYNLYKQAVDKAREPLISRIEENTKLMKSGQLSGNEYRNRIRELEADMAKIPGTLQAVPEYAQVIKGIEKNPKEPKNQLERFLNEYYQISDDTYDKDTGSMDVEALISRREKLKSQYPSDVVSRAMKDISRHRDPEYVKALTEYGELMSIPKYPGLSTEQGKKADKVAATVEYIRSKSRQTGEFIDFESVVRKLYGPDALDLYGVARRGRESFERAEYRRTHPLIDKFFGRMPSDLAPADLVVSK